MHVSIVTGTFNRLPLLQSMVASARGQFPRHIQFEFVVVDGGSTDGTLEWLETQPDVRLIRHGGLKGAIRAFCDGAAQARGEYVLMANDDIQFRPYSIMRALCYLEETRTCGGVAFADDRGQQLGHGKGHRVERMPAIDPDGKPTALVYAQVGLFRRWIGELVGWWGANDEHMRNARTYGGDNYLSARIWELGYSIDAVDGCAIDDVLPDDQLRQHNRGISQNDSAQYYGRFPRGPYTRAVPQVPNAQKERLRAVLMDIHEPRLPARTAKEAGLAEALSEVSLLWHIDYVNDTYDLPAVIGAWRPHILIVQMHDTSRIDAHVLRAAREQNPEMVIVNWNGDAHHKGLTSPDVIEALHEVDLQTTINLAVQPTYDREGIQSAYWQIGYKEPAAPYPGTVPAHEILWQGNCYDERRLQLVARLRSMGFDVGVYGSCPEADGNTHYDFGHQAALYQAATVVIGDTFPGTIGFVSNRLFQALGAGAFLLQEHSDRLDELTGLTAGEHYIQWHDLDDLQDKVRHWMNPGMTAERLRIALNGREFVRKNFSYPAQVRKLWSLLPQD